MNKKIIIKFGTNSLTKNGKLNQQIFDLATKQISKLINQDYGVIIVSSGAVKAGQENYFNKGASKKDLAGMGSRYLLNLWATAFDKFNLQISQVLITYANLCHRQEYESIISHLNFCIENKVIPVINENDVVSQQEIELMDKGISENDRLAYLISEIIQPEFILFITESGGVFENYKTKNQKKYLEVDSKNLPSSVLRSMNSSQNGSGGIAKKLIEASRCFQIGRLVAITGIRNIVKSVTKQRGCTIIASRNILE